MKALDLFCGAGGASMGLHRAGYDVTGVDIEPQPNYPFAFIQGDALEADVLGFDLVWASPPCQRYSMYSRNMGTSGNHPDLMEPTRALLARASGRTIIENVVGAPLRADIMLCGSMFGLRVRRHRLFECNFQPGLALSCNHTGLVIPVFGHGTPQWHRRRLGRNISLEEKKQAMGIDWMNRDELSNAIPPAYSEFLARAA